MTSNALSERSVRIAFPTREELREMLTDPSVARTLIVCVSFLAALALGGVVFLAYTGHEYAVVAALITATAAAIGPVLNGRIRRHVDEAVKQKGDSNGPQGD